MEEQANHTRYLVSFYRGEGYQYSQFVGNFLWLYGQYGIGIRSGMLYDDNIDLSFHLVF